METFPYISSALECWWNLIWNINLDQAQHPSRSRILRRSPERSGWGILNFWIAFCFGSTFSFIDIEYQSGTKTPLVLCSFGSSRERLSLIIEWVNVHERSTQRPDTMRREMKNCWECFFLSLSIVIIPRLVSISFDLNFLSPRKHTAQAQLTLIHRAAFLVNQIMSRLKSRENSNKPSSFNEASSCSQTTLTCFFPILTRFFHIAWQPFLLDTIFNFFCQAQLVTRILVLSSRIRRSSAAKIFIFFPFRLSSAAQWRWEKFKRGKEEEMLSWSRKKIASGLLYSISFDF